MLFQVFLPWKCIKIYGLPLSTVTLTVNSHADNHFYKYIYKYYYYKYYYYYFYKYYTVWNRFFIRIRVKVFYIQIQFTCKNPLLFFPIKMLVYRKKTLYRKKKSLLSTWCSLVTSHAIWVDEIMRVTISIKMMNKNQNILKK